MTEAVAPRILHEDPTVAWPCCPCPATVHPQVAERGEIFTRRIYELAPGCYGAIEYTGCSVMATGDEGAVVVGVLSHLSDGQLVAGHFSKLRGDRPIRAVVYNDSLSDNYGGVEAFVDEAEVQSGAVRVIAHESFERMMKNIGDIADIAAWRGAYQAGALLPPGPEGLVHAGAIAFTRGKVSYIAPTQLVDSQWRGNIGGVELEIRHFPAESDDGIVTWFPQHKVLVAGHVLFGDLLPQVYAQRGVVRNPRRWYKGIEDFIRFVESIDVEVMVPMHFFEPIVGRARIMEVLTINRDTLQFIADQSARYINKGYRADDLAQTVKLPPHLAAHPELQEHYGRLQQHLRQQFHDHLGWFGGDPTFLDPLSETERAGRYVAAIGGRAAVLAQALAAEAREPLWAAELLSLLIRIDLDDAEARARKAAILRRLGHAAPNATYRNWLLTSALEIEQKLPPIRMDKSAFVPEKILAALSPAELLETLKARLMAERCFDLDCRINLRFANDEAAPISAWMRRGVLDVKPQALSSAELGLRLTVATLRALADGKTDIDAALRDGTLRVEQGDNALLSRVAACFEPAAGGNFPLALPTALPSTGAE